MSRVAPHLIYCFLGILFPDVGFLTQHIKTLQNHNHASKKPSIVCLLRLRNYPYKVNKFNCHKCVLSSLPYV